MSFVRMRAPEGCTSFAHQGYGMKLDADGTVSVDPRHVNDYTAHGFVPAGEPRNTAQGLAAERIFAADPRPPVEPSPLSGMSPDTVAFLNRLAAKPGSLDRLAAMLEAETAAMPDPRAAPPVSEPETGDPISLDGKLTDDQIDHMTKAQCLAWCKANDVPAVPPIDLDVLRAKIKAKQG